MQSNISANFIQLTQIISEEKIKALNSFLKYHINARITCNDIANRLDISFDEAKLIIRILLKTNVLEMSFKVNCYDEHLTAMPLYYDVFEDIPDEICDDCNKKCQILRKVIIMYKVIKGELNETNARG